METTIVHWTRSPNSQKKQREVKAALKYELRRGGLRVRSSRCGVWGFVFRDQGEFRANFDGNISPHSSFWTSHRKYSYLNR